MLSAKPRSRMSSNHSDGSRDSFEVKHTLNDEQIEWFEASSALNEIRSEAGVG